MNRKIWNICSGIIASYTKTPDGPIIKMITKVESKNQSRDFPGHVVWNPPSNARDICSIRVQKILHAVGQLQAHATTLEPMLWNKWNHTKKPVCCNEKQPSRTATRESSQAAMKTQHKNKKIKEKWKQDKHKTGTDLSETGEGIWGTILQLQNK